MNRPSVPFTSNYRSGQWISEEDFGLLCARASDLRLERTAEGTLVMMSPANSGAGRSNAKLTMRLVHWAEADGRGEVFDSSAGFTLPNGAIRSPDASWIERDRWEALSPAERSSFAPICPDFVVELRSKTDAKAELRDKMREYLEQGARLGWLIDPLTAMVEIYRPSQPVEVLERPSELAGQDILPGFVLDLSDILDD